MPMKEIDETIAAVREVLMRAHKDAPDAFLVRSFQQVEAENASLRHRVKCLETENGGLYAKLELLREQQEGRD